jgi:hypothetical protein
MERKSQDTWRRDLLVVVFVGPILAMKALMLIFGWETGIFFGWGGLTIAGIIVWMYRHWDALITR